MTETATNISPKHPAVRWTRHAIPLYSKAPACVDEIFQKMNWWTRDTIEESLFVLEKDGFAERVGTDRYGRPLWRRRSAVDMAEIAENCGVRDLRCSDPLLDRMRRRDDGDEG